jgi:hypothetical protein
MVSRPQLIAFFLTWFGFLPLAAAHPQAHGGYRVTVQDESGRELPTFQHEGQSFVLGSYGDRYNIRVENQTGRRVEAVVTVDGRDVVSGRVGDYVGERGYIIDPYGQVLIEGFRQTYQQVAAFRFVSPGQSYSSRMGTPQNVGVIGVAIFPERWRAPVRQKVAPERIRPSSPRSLDDLGRGATRERSASDAAEGEYAERRSGGYAPEPAAEPPPPSVDNLGTEYGESVASSVQEVQFQRADSRHPAAVLTLRYDDRAGLLARGIAIDPPYYRPEYYSAPSAFPRNRRFAPPPPGY